MLEAFVAKVKGRKVRMWMDAEDSIANMEWIEHVYEKVRRIRSTILCLGADELQTGLGVRPASTFVLSE